MRSDKFLSALLLLILIGGIEPVYAVGVIDGTIEKYDVAAQLFGKSMRDFGIKLLLSLFATQLGWNALQWALKGADLGEIASSFTRSVIGVGFFAFLITSGESGLQWIIDSFHFLGASGAGIGQLTPSAIFTQGVDLQDTMVARFNDATGANNGLFAAIKNFYPAMMLTIASLIIIASFAVLAWQMALAMISGYFWLAVLPILMGFHGTQWTKDIALTSLKGGITIGMKIMVVYLISGVAGTLAPLWGESMQAVTLTDWMPIWHVVFGAGLLAYLSFQAPKLAGDLLNGTASLSAGDATTNMIGMAATAAGGVAAAGMVAGGAMAATGMAGKAMGAGASQGLSSFDKTLAAAAGAMGDAFPSSPRASDIGPETMARAPAFQQAFAEKARTATGNASGGSIGAGSGSASGEQAKSNKPSLRQRIQSVRSDIPQDAHTVGLNANITNQSES